MKAFIRDIPKAELHLHIEGTLEPELMFELAERNRLRLPYSTVEAVRKAYKFTNLQSFLDLYYQGTGVLLTEQDFYDVTRAYLEKARSQNVRHAEIFFDPQAHTTRGVAFQSVITGIHEAMEYARRHLGVSCGLILCFLRDLSPEQAFETLREALAFREWIIGVGLDSAEARNPPEKFKEVFDEARRHDLLTVAHAGEEGPPEFIRQALDLLKVSRIDHGVRCTEDPELVARLRHERIPLTVCPLSNVKLRIFKSMQEHNLKRLLGLGLCVTVNSDDPAYFGGYITENLMAVQDALDLNQRDIYTLVKNSFDASFLSAGEKQALIQELDRFVSAQNPRPSKRSKGDAA